MNKNASPLSWMVLAAFLACSLETLQGGVNGVPTGGAKQKSESEVLDYLKSISGKQTVSGIHNREPNRKPSLQTDHLFKVVGRCPGLWSGDFLFKAEDVTNRWTMIHECKKQWDEGSIVQLMLHVAPPDQPEECQWRGGVLSHYSDAQWKDLVSDGGSLNKAWKSRLDGYAVYLEYLKTNHVQVLFRPHHEMNQGGFWWGGQKGPEGTAKLYRITHDYLVKEKGLNNPIWVWDLQDSSRDFAAYDPGDKFVQNVFMQHFGPFLCWRGISCMRTWSFFQWPILRVQDSDSIVWPIQCRSDGMEF